MTFAVLLALTIGRTLVVGLEARAAGEGKLEGTWLNEVKIVTCPLALPAVLVTFESMTTSICAATH
jgi:hypothetical protein